MKMINWSTNIACETIGKQQPTSCGRFHSVCTSYCSYVYRLSKQEALAKVNGSCHFMNGTGRSAVALVSFPGSGNTWVRGLLETATGVCTGELY